MTPLDEIREVHLRLWKSKQDVSSATKCAQRITKEWQEKVLAGHERFFAEFPVSGLGEKIDLVDLELKIAYELKVSPNNTHMEFYRDMFKVLAHNDHAQKIDQISKLVFIAPQEGLYRLQRGLGEAACRISHKFGFTVELVGL